MQQIAFTAHHKAELVSVPDLPNSLGDREVRGRTVLSLTSPGTELNWQYNGKEFPAYPGYACIFRVDAVGPAVTAFAPGDIVYGGGPHREYQSLEDREVARLPTGVAPEQAVFGRLAAVSMSALILTSARPPARVLVTGLGPVGNLAAQVFQSCGYRVTAADPIADRCADARSRGLKDVRSSLEGLADELAGTIGLHLECSGHEQAVLDGAKLVAEGSEIVLIGVPWQRRTELYSFELLNTMFYRYVTVRSGWEWRVPRFPERFSHNSIADNLEAAMRWIAEGRLNVTDMAEVRPVTEAQQVYEGLLARNLSRSSVIFDWRRQA